MLPKELQDILDEAKKSVIEHPKGELILPIRKKIWKALGEMKLITEETAAATIGLKRRLELARLCVEKVIDSWKEMMGNNKRPLKMIEIAEQHINGNIDSETIFKYYNDFVKLVNDISLSVKYQGAASAGYAAIYMVDIALGDEALLINSYDDMLDEELDPNIWDSSYEACSAYSGGSPSDEYSNKEKRQEFWLWYIDEAVPKAYSAYEDNLNAAKGQVINELYSFHEFHNPLLNKYKEIENFIEENISEGMVTGGIEESRIKEVEESLDIILPYSYKWFLKKYGYLILFGEEILGGGKSDIPSVVLHTNKDRDCGLPHQYVVIGDCGEWIYCLDTNSIKNDECSVISWDMTGFIKECDDSFTSFMLNTLKEAKENWYD